MMRFGGPKDIKKFVSEYIFQNREELEGKIVLDIPAGNGYSSEILNSIGAKVKAYDLFPEFFNVDGIQCEWADLREALPIESSSADYVLCQEGIEHIPNQINLFRELSRVLKPGGKLLLTTPNYSNLRSRMSYFLDESEIFNMMPPNELDSVWISDARKNKKDIYFGHVFLQGIQKLKLFGLLAGFKITKIHHLRINFTSLLLLFLFYPLIWLANYHAYRRAIRNRIDVPMDVRKKVYKASFNLGVNPKILLDQHLFIEFEKECEADESLDFMGIHSKYKDWDVTT